MSILSYHLYFKEAIVAKMKINFQIKLVNIWILFVLHIYLHLGYYKIFELATALLNYC